MDALIKISDGIVSFVEQINRLKEQFPGVDNLYFKQPIETRKYKVSLYADMIVGIKLKSRSFIDIDGGWHCTQNTVLSTCRIEALGEYAKIISTLKKNEFSTKNIWSENQCEEFFEKELRKKKYQNKQK